MSEIELLPCPFCGGEAKARRCCEDDRHTYINCKSCGAGMSSRKNRGTSESWNRRHEAAASSTTATETTEAPQSNGETV